MGKSIKESFLQSSPALRGAGLKKGGSTDCMGKGLARQAG